MSVDADRPSRLSVAVPSRRTVTRAAIWTIPAVTVAAASPAFASSNGAIVLDKGLSAILASDGFWNLEFGMGGQIRGEGTFTRPVTVTVTVTFLDASGDNSDNIFYWGATPTGWQGPSETSGVDKVVLTSVGKLEPGGSLPLSDGRCGTEFSSNFGEFVLTIAADGMEGVVEVFPTGSNPPPVSAARGVAEARAVTRSDLLTLKGGEG